MRAQPSKSIGDSAAIVVHECEDATQKEQKKKEKKKKKKKKRKKREIEMKRKAIKLNKTIRQTKKKGGEG